MAAHAVDDNKQGRVLGHCGRHPVLVFFACPDEADISVLDPQEGTHASVRIGRALYHSRPDERKPHLSLSARMQSPT